MFVVVLSILVVNTIVAMGPLVFLSLGEIVDGQIDAIFSPRSPGIYTNEEYLSYEDTGSYINYTKVIQLYGS